MKVVGLTFVKLENKLPIMETYENAGRGTAVRARSPIGTRVAANVEELRKLRQLTQQEVAARMGELGRPLSVSAISKIEKGQRRVDPDDLVALAVALNVSPMRLLLAGEANTNMMALTPQLEVESSRAWKWAKGAHPLPVSAIDHMIGSGESRGLTIEEREAMALKEYDLGTTPPQLGPGQPMVQALRVLEDRMNVLFGDQDPQTKLDWVPRVNNAGALHLRRLQTFESELKTHIAELEDREETDAT